MKHIKGYVNLVEAVFLKIPVPISDWVFICKMKCLSPTPELTQRLSGGGNLGICIPLSIQMIPKTLKFKLIVNPRLNDRASSIWDFKNKTLNLKIDSNIY